MVKCDLQVISPVHIGSGEKYTASEYVQSTARSNKGNKLKLVKRIDLSKYYLSLDDNNKDDFLLNLSNGNFELERFDKKISNNYVLYKSINKAKKDLLPSHEISECIKTLNNPYIPGSSVKGAIKTAILYNQIDDEKISKLEKDILNDKGRVNRWQYDKFLEKIFSTKFTRNAAQGDVMKFLQVSDSSYVKNITIYDIVTVMASFKILTNEYYRKNKKSIEPTLSHLETIPRGAKLSIEIKNNYNSIVFDELRLGTRSNFIEIENIKKAMYRFSADLIDNEIEFAKDNDIKYLLKFYKDLSKRNTQNSPVLKIGHGSGFLATTIGLKIKNYSENSDDKLYYENLGDENLDDGNLYNRIRLGLRSNTYNYSFPKSRKVTYSGGMPLGWVKFNFSED